MQRGESLPPQAGLRVAQLSPLAAHDPGFDRTRRPFPDVAQAVGLGQIEHQRHCRQVMKRRQIQQAAARAGLHIGGVDDGEPAAPQPFLDDAMGEPEGGAADRLVGGVIAQQGAAVIGADDPGGREVAAPIITSRDGVGMSIIRCRGMTGSARRRAVSTLRT